MFETKITEQIVSRRSVLRLGAGLLAGAVVAAGQISNAEALPSPLPLGQSQAEKEAIARQTCLRQQAMDIAVFLNPTITESNQQRQVKIESRPAVAEVVNSAATISSVDGDKTAWLNLDTDPYDGFAATLWAERDLPDGAARVIMSAQIRPELVSELSSMLRAGQQPSPELALQIACDPQTTFRTNLLRQFTGDHSFHYVVGGPVADVGQIPTPIFAADVQNFRDLVGLAD